MYLWQKLQVAKHWQANLQNDSVFHSQDRSINRPCHNNIHVSGIAENDLVFGNRYSRKVGGGINLLSTNEEKEAWAVLAFCLRFHS